MQTSTARKRQKRTHSESSEEADQTRDEASDSESRVRLPAEEDPSQFGNESPSLPPPSGYDLDRLYYHIELQEFGRGLQNAANAVFSCERRSRYTRVSALLLSWEDEDPQLPVSLEIAKLRDVLVSLYGFDVEEWQIPALRSHEKLNSRILDFLDSSDAKHLKIVYYAGHGKLSNHGQAIWTSHRNSRKDRKRIPTVKWSGIQTALEESDADVLILLDCCASGMSNTDEGNGVTELIAACPFNDSANGVGQFSFTYALVCQLEKLAHMPSFTIGYLYNLLFTYIQVDNSRQKRAPIHLVLTQDHRLPRSITISPKPARSLDPFKLSIPTSAITSPDPATTEGLNVRPQIQPGSSPTSPAPSAGKISPFSNDASSSATSLSRLPEYPRLLFSVRISEDIKPRQLCTELFADWLATLPMDTKHVRIEAGFASDSTILMVSLPIAMFGYLPKDPAIILLGTTRSQNLLTIEPEPASSTGKMPVSRDLNRDADDVSNRDGHLEKLERAVSIPQAYHTQPKFQVGSDTIVTEDPSQIDPSQLSPSPDPPLISLPPLLSPILLPIIEDELVSFQQKSAEKAKKSTALNTAITFHEKDWLPNIPSIARKIATPKVEYLSKESRADSSKPEEAVDTNKDQDDVSLSDGIPYPPAAPALSKNRTSYAIEWTKNRSRSNIKHACTECKRADAFCQLGTLPVVCIRCQSHRLACNYDSIHIMSEQEINRKLSKTSQIRLRSDRNGL